MDADDFVNYLSENEDKINENVDKIWKALDDQYSIMIIGTLIKAVAVMLKHNSKISADHCKNQNIEFDEKNSMKLQLKLINLILYHSLIKESDE